MTKTASSKTSENRLPSVVTVGTIAFDTIHTPTQTAKSVLGGSALYFSLAARLFGRPGIISAVGNDFPASRVKELETLGIDLAGVQHLDGRRTFSWEGKYLEGLRERETLKVDVGIFDAFEPKLPDAWKDIPFLFLANGSPGHQLSVLKQAKGARCVVSDSMNLWISTQIDGVTELFKNSHGVVLNDEEARQFTGESNLLVAARRIAALGPTFVVVKRGENGCLCVYGRQICVLPAYPLETYADPTGAGDSFAGALMGVLAARGTVDSAGLRDALVWGTVVGSICVETLGPGSLLEATRASIEERRRRYLTMVEGVR